jgi:hypothetical protein
MWGKSIKMKTKKEQRQSEDLGSFELHQKMASVILNLVYTYNLLEVFVLLNIVSFLFIGSFSVATIDAASAGCL